MQRFLFLFIIVFGLLLSLNADPATGTVTAANSITGGNTNDKIGFSNGSTGELPSGNIVISASNSLVGSSTTDQVGSDGITVLSGGHYVVSSMSWHLASSLAFAGVAIGER